MGIRNYDANKVLQAAVKMQTTPAQKVYSGFAGNRDLKEYEKHKYVPSDKGRFSNTMEYSYDDWTVGAISKVIGKNRRLYQKFNDRGNWWKNAIDTERDIATLKLSRWEWTKILILSKAAPIKNMLKEMHGRLTFFVPQDVPGINNMIGKKKFIDRLEWGFDQSEPWRYNGMNDQYWDYPVVQGNQQSMHFAFLFNWAGKPWSTQKWSRSILDRFYGYGVSNAYLGDEDQGQMSAWLVMVSIGLFQTDGGAVRIRCMKLEALFIKRVAIDLGEKFGKG